ncbi:SdiA-regulated domain-containing protein [Metapseudomonas boanensis]|uniref:SdiA-regulated domain-containing protein n=1 Tax=Metapseudomonas boanensis TaxID=2822138 RepID=A0ABS5XNB1_9GAMM|nr:SdiA-regulated domain-containing protein [Pseudomonas boanensis]MBT8769189.1 SdiA-regulated domain-containing protein [Pseudomonas boanensis]
MNSAVGHHRRKHLSHRSWRPLCLWALGAAAIAFVGYAVIKFHWHQRLYYTIVSSMNTDQQTGRNIWLPDYKIAIEARPIAGIDDDLSAIAYDYDKGRLLAVTNATPVRLVVLGKDGALLEAYPLTGFQDVEGLAYMGDGLVAVTDEDAQRLNFFHLPEQPGTAIDVKDTEFLSLGINLSTQNKGFEGITYDADHDRLFIAKEKGPRQLYQVSGIKQSLAGKLQVSILDLTPWVERSVFTTDISDLHYDAKTSHLLVLSDESKLIIELSDDGEMVSYRSLQGQLSDLKHSAPQAEGLTLDTEGNLYVVSEPNLFYVFKKP